MGVGGRPLSKRTIPALRDPLPLRAYTRRPGHSCGMSKHPGRTIPRDPPIFSYHSHREVSQVRDHGSQCAAEQGGALACASRVPWSSSVSLPEHCRMGGRGGVEPPSSPWGLGPHLQTPPPEHKAWHGRAGFSMENVGQLGPKGAASSCGDWGQGSALEEWGWRQGWGLGVLPPVQEPEQPCPVGGIEAKAHGLRAAHLAAREVEADQPRHGSGGHHREAVAVAEGVDDADQAPRTTHPQHGPAAPRPQPRGLGRRGVAGEQLFGGPVGHLRRVEERRNSDIDTDAQKTRAPVRTATLWLMGVGRGGGEWLFSCGWVSVREMPMPSRLHLLRWVSDMRSVWVCICTLVQWEAEYWF